eukprot:768802-Hanusia_phi.AAC.16
MAAADEGGGSGGGSTRQVVSAGMWAREETSGRSISNLSDIGYTSSLRHPDAQPTHTLETYYPKMLEKLEIMQDRQRQSEEIRDQLERDKRELQRQLSSQTKKLQLMEIALENEKESSRIHANILNERIDALKDQIRAHEELSEKSADGYLELQQKDKEIQLLNEAIEELEKEKDHAIFEERKRCEAENEKVLNFLAKTLEELEQSKEKNKEVLSLKREIAELQVQLEELPYAQKICEIYTEFFTFVDNCACLNEAGSHKWKETDRNIRIHRRTRIERSDRSVSPFSKASASPRLSENDPILAATKDKNVSVEAKDAGSKETTESLKPKHSENGPRGLPPKFPTQVVKPKYDGNKGQKGNIEIAENTASSSHSFSLGTLVSADASLLSSTVSKQKLDPTDLDEQPATSQILTESGEKLWDSVQGNDYVQVAAELKRCQEKLVYWQNESNYLAEQVRTLQKQCQESSLRRNEALNQVQDLQIRLKEQEILHTSRESAYTEASQKNLDSLESQLETAKSQCRIFSDELLDKSAEISKITPEKSGINYKRFSMKSGNRSLRLIHADSRFRVITIEIAETFQLILSKQHKSFTHEAQDMLNTASAISNIMNDMNYIQHNFDRLATDIQPLVKSHSNQTNSESQNQALRPPGNSSKCQYQIEWETLKGKLNKHVKHFESNLRIVLSQDYLGNELQLKTMLTESWNSLKEVINQPLIDLSDCSGHEIVRASVLNGGISGRIEEDVQGDHDCHVLPVQKLADICDGIDYHGPSSPDSGEVKKVNVKLNFSELDELSCSHDWRKLRDNRQYPTLPRKFADTDTQHTDTALLIEKLQHHNSVLNHQLSLKSTEIEILYGELESIKSNLGSEDFSIGDLHTELSIAAVKAEAQLQILQLEERVWATLARHASNVTELTAVLAGARVGGREGRSGVHTTVPGVREEVRDP